MTGRTRKPPTRENEKRGLKRMVAGESLFMTRFRGRSESQVAFAAPHPGELKQVDLDPGRNWLCQRDSFLCATEGVHVDIAFTGTGGVAGVGGTLRDLGNIFGRGE